MGAIIFAREENRNAGCGEGFDGFQQDARETHSKYRLWSKRVGFAPLDVKHWHGASADSWFQHLAIEVPGENCSNEWCEPISDEAYAKLEEEV